MTESCNKFYDVFTQNANGTGELLVKNLTTVTGRSNVLFASYGSTLAIHISGTATVQIVSNPFGDSAKDFVIKTITATTQEVVTSAMYITLVVTAITGTVTAELIFNED